MKTLFRVWAVILSSWFLSTAANADTPATLAGTVRDSNGRALSGAEVRIVGRDADKVGKVHTDSAGHYSYPGLETGIYNVSLAVNGAVKASINNVRTKSGEVQILNFDFQSAGSARPFAKGKHYVWIPTQTGSHLGTWVEVDDDSKAMPIGMQERIRNSGNTLTRQIQSSGLQGGPKS